MILVKCLLLLLLGVLARREDLPAGAFAIVPAESVDFLVVLRLCLLKDFFVQKMFV